LSAITAVKRVSMQPSMPSTTPSNTRLAKAAKGSWGHCTCGKPVGMGPMRRKSQSAMNKLATNVPNTRATSWGGTARRQGLG
jgi:hypothetical protein